MLPLPPDRQEPALAKPRPGIPVGTIAGRYIPRPLAFGWDDYAPED